MLKSTIFLKIKTALENKYKIQEKMLKTGKEDLMF